MSLRKSPPNTIKVTIVDDSEEICLSLVELLETTPDIEVVSTFGSAEETLLEFDDDVPDVVLMDLRLPGMSGVECVRQLKEQHPSLHIMMFTAFGEDDEALFQSLRVGASGYMLKRSSAASLVDAIRDLHAGGSPMSPSIARKVVRFFHAAPAPIQPQPSESQPLSARETQVVEMLAEGLRYKEIAEGLDLSVTTVRTHLGRIYDKMHVTSRTEAVVKFLKSKA